MKKGFILILCFLLLNISCFRNEKSQIDTIFSLKIGFGTNDVGGNFEKLSDKMFYVINKDGFFYILDGINNKVMKVTEKGDVILIIYNQESNPHIKPLFPVKSETEDLTVYTKLYRDFKIINPLLLEVDNRKNIYLVNRDPEYKKMVENIGIKDQLILKFDSSGTFLNYIGVDGIGNGPFSSITELKVDNNNNLLVRETLDDGIYIYKFSENGKLLKKVKLTKENIPVLTNEMEYIIDFVNIKLSNFEDEVYISSQFIRSFIENFSIIKYETMYEKIFVYSLKSEKYEKLLFKINPEFVDLTKISDNRYIKTLYGDNKIIMKPMKEFIGVDLNYNLYFKDTQLPLNTPIPNKFTLNIYDINGRNIKNIDIQYPVDIDYFSDMILSRNGGVYSYYIKNGEIFFARLK